MTPEPVRPTLQYSGIGIYPPSVHSDAIGGDFCYDWRKVQDAAKKRGCNLDVFLTAPLAKRLTDKRLKTPVSFWYTPLGNLFVVTVCSSKNVNFFDPLRSMPGYLEYGENHLRPTARPFLHWDGSHVIRVQALRASADSAFFVGDFGNGFGLTVAESGEESYRRIQDDPVAYFEYFAVPIVSPTEITWKANVVQVYYRLCVL